MRRCGAGMLLLMLLLLAGCAAEPTTRTFFAMDTVMSLTIWGDDAAAEAAEARIHELEAALSVTRPDSEIATLNRTGTAELSPQTAQLLQQSLAMGALTGGALDVTIQPVAALWGFSTGEYHKPTDAAIQAALPQVGYQLPQWEGNCCTLPAGGGVTLGAVAKGYAADEVAALLQAQGVASAVISLGGNVQTLGSKPDGTDWQIAILDPQDTQSWLGILSVSGSRAVVTSGGYQRCFEAEGTTWHHILDPATGYPADSGLISVTILADSGFYADALSTAVYVMGRDAATALWRARQDFDMVLVEDDGTIWATEGVQWDTAAEVIR